MKAIIDDGGSLMPFGIGWEYEDLFSVFVQLRYSHIRIESNNLAHSLARHVLNVLDYTMLCEWIMFLHVLFLYFKLT